MQSCGGLTICHARKEKGNETAGSFSWLVISANYDTCLHECRCRSVARRHGNDRFEQRNFTGQLTLLCCVRPNSHVINGPVYVLQPGTNHVLLELKGRLNRSCSKFVAKVKELREYLPCFRLFGTRIFVSAHCQDWPCDVSETYNSRCTGEDLAVLCWALPYAARFDGQTKKQDPDIHESVLLQVKFVEGIFKNSIIFTGPTQN